MYIQERQEAFVTSDGTIVETDGRVPWWFSSKWMLNRQQRAIHEPEFRDPVPQYGVYRPQYGVYRPAEYNMQTFPPPRYDPSQPSPPTYQPPEGASKVDPSQYRSEPTRRPPSNDGDESPEYSAPPGPPPAAVTANHTGSSSSNPFRL